MKCFHRAWCIIALKECAVHKVWWVEQGGVVFTVQASPDRWGLGLALCWLLPGFRCRCISKWVDTKHCWHDPFRYMVCAYLFGVAWVCFRLSCGFNAQFMYLILRSTGIRVMQLGLQAGPSQVMMDQPRHCRSVRSLKLSWCYWNLNLLDFRFFAKSGCWPKCHTIFQNQNAFVKTSIQVYHMLSIFNHQNPEASQHCGGELGKQEWVSAKVGEGI